MYKKAKVPVTCAEAERRLARYTQRSCHSELFVATRDDEGWDRKQAQFGCQMAEFRSDARCQMPDSRFQIIDYRFQIPDCRFEIPDSGFQLRDPSFHIPDDATTPAPHGGCLTSQMKTIHVWPWARDTSVGPVGPGRPASPLWRFLPAPAALVRLQRWPRASFAAVNKP